MISRWADRIRVMAARVVRGPAASLVICAGLLAGGLIELATLRHDRAIPVAVVACTVCTLAPALGRRLPVVSALVAVGAVAVYQVVTDDPNGDFVVAATVLACYFLGRDHPGTASNRRMLVTALVGLPGFLAAGASGHGSIGASVGTWVLTVVVPAGVGRVVARRQTLVAQLEAATRALRLDELRAADAATSTERARVARELHDVVAHHVSVMVIQAGAARMVAASDPKAAGQALDAVESAGRRSLDELRRVLGVLRRDGDDGGFDRAVDCEQLNALCGQVAGAGVTVTLTCSSFAELPPSVSLAAYRIVQEALTNVARHAPGSHATVSIDVQADEVKVLVADNGRRLRPAVPALPSGGHGLIGMAERAAWAGGSLCVGPRPAGGFEVCARLPLQPSEPPVRPLVSPGWSAEQPGDHEQPRRRWTMRPGRGNALFAAIAAVVLAGNAGLTATGSARVVCIAGGLALGLLAGWRTQHPLAYLGGTLVVLAALTIASPTVSDDSLFGLFALVVPTYTIAAWMPARTAALSFMAWSAGAGLHAVRDHNSAGRFVGGYVMALVIFALGRVVRSQRLLSAELSARNRALADRRDQRARAAVVSERIRIARDLHVHIAATITAMVVQATAAKQRVAADPQGALAAASGVERDGREVLAEMRRVLGVLRADRAVPLQPASAQVRSLPPMVPA